MNCRLTEQELIDFLFKLADAPEMERIQAQLDSCADCRRKLDELAERLSILDALKADYPVSDRVVNDVLRQVEQEESMTVAEPYPFRWLAAAAAIMLLLVWWSPWKNPEVARKPADDKPAPYIDRVEPIEDAELAALREEPPFPPASAIELNVLPTRDDVQITIYNSADLTLVRERRKLTMKKGWNWLQFMWANTLIDPTSLTLEPVTHRDRIDVEQLVFPPRLKDLGRWLMFSEISGEAEFELTYLTSGLSWRAFYMGTLSPREETMRLDGYVRVSNQSGEDYEQAQTRLIVGKVNLLDKIADLAKRPSPYGSPIVKPGDTYRNDLVINQYAYILNTPNESTEFLADLSDLQTKVIKKQGLSEYFLYTIEGRETIPHGWGKRLPSFSVEDIPVVSRYKYNEERWGREVVRFVAFANSEAHDLGETPLPNGMARIYRELPEDGRLSYVGGTSVKYIPVDEKVELDLGPARQVEVEPRLMDFKTANHQFNGAKDLLGWDEVRTWDLTSRNTRDIPVEMEITRGFGTVHWDIEVAAEAGYEKHDMSHARFKLTLPPASEKTIRYVITTYHGKRETER
ncbi:MAG: DUF4139 domain-containing protein [Verrucomicrobiota bacterium]